MNISPIIDFLTPVNLEEINEDQGYNNSQYGTYIEKNLDNETDLNDFDIAILGCEEYRGMGISKTKTNSANSIRRELYKLYCWREKTKIADIGNIKKGASLNDTYAAVKTVLRFFLEHNKRVILIGGSQDLTIPQYQSFEKTQQIVDCVNIDYTIDFDVEGNVPVHNYLEYIFTNIPNHLRNFNLVGFQSYYSHIEVLETIKNLQFDIFRLGATREDLLDTEPVFRNSHFVSLDINSIQYAHAPANLNSPNGFTGVEICTLAKFAGMSNKCMSFGVYNFLSEKDQHNITAKQISQLIWYFILGHTTSLKEKPLSEKQYYDEYIIPVENINENLIFLHSKITDHWWMSIKDNKFIACSIRDFENLKNRNEIPERWLRELERL